MDLSIAVATIFLGVFPEFYGGCIRVTGAKVVLGTGTCFSYLLEMRTSWMIYDFCFSLAKKHGKRTHQHRSGTGSRSIVTIFVRERGDSLGL